MLDLVSLWLILLWVTLAFHSSPEWRMCTLLSTTHKLLQTTLAPPPQAPNYFVCRNKLLFPKNTYQPLSCFVLVEFSQSSGKEWPQWESGTSAHSAGPTTAATTDQKKNPNWVNPLPLKYHKGHRSVNYVSLIQSEVLHLYQNKSTPPKKTNSQTKKRKEKIYTLTLALTEFKITLSVESQSKVTAQNCTEKTPSKLSCQFQVSDNFYDTVIPWTLKYECSPPNA